MQKKVLAAALGAMFIAPAAFAADVNISGRLAVGLENYDVSPGPGLGDADAEMRVSDQSSSIIFTGSEDLGGGLEAWFKLDNRFSLPDAGFSASGNTQVGLRGDWGTLAIGRADLHYNEMFQFEGLPSASLQTRVTGSVFSQVNGTPIANTTRTPNVIMWDGAFGGGLTATVAYSTSGITPSATESALEDEGDAITAALRWSGGPLSVGASFWSAENDAIPASAEIDPGTGLPDITPAVPGGAVEHESVRAWAGYTFGNITAGFGYDVSSITVAGAETERTAFAIPVKINLGADSFSVAVAMADDREGPTGDVDDSGATIMSVGWNRALSKRTHVGVYYSDLDNDDNANYNFFANSLSGTAPSAVGAGTDASQLYLGIAHFY